MADRIMLSNREKFEWQNSLAPFFRAFVLSPLFAILNILVPTDAILFHVTEIILSRHKTYMQFSTFLFVINNIFFTTLEQFKCYQMLHDNVYALNTILGFLVEKIRNAHAPTRCQCLSSINVVVVIVEKLLLIIYYPYSITFNQSWKVTLEKLPLIIYYFYSIP